MKNKTTYLLIVALFFTAQHLIGQDYPHHQLTINDGLPSNYVYGAIEDENGYIWAYTEKGIAKYDGYEFKKYSIENGLPVNDIYQIHQNKYGRLWMLGIGSSFAYIKNDSIFNIESNTDSRAALITIGDELLYRSGESIWITHDDYLEKKEFESTVEINLNDNHKSNIRWVNKPNNEYFGLDFNNSTLVQVDENRKITKIKFKEQAPENSSILSYFYVQTTQPYYLILEKNGIFKIGETSEEISFNPWSNFFEKEINSTVVEIYNKKVNISTNHGLVTILESGEFQSIDFPTLGNIYTFNKTFKDKKENIWIGTKEGGLLFFSAEQLQSKLINGETINDNIFKYIKKTSIGDLIGITSKGSIYNIDTGMKLQNAFPRPATVYDAFLNKQDQLIITANAGSSKFISLNPSKENNSNIDPRLVNFNYLNQKDNATLLKSQNIKNIIQISDIDLYLNIIPGISRLFVNQEGEVEFKIIGPRQRLLYKSPKSKTIYSADKDHLFSISNEEKLSKVLSLPLITSLCPYGNTGLLIGTESSGLYKYTFDENQITKIGDYGSITKLYINDSQVIYTSSNEGINKLELVDEKYQIAKHWGLNQGLPSLEVLDFIIDKNHMYAATANGIAKINLNATTPKKENPSIKLKINEVKINNEFIESGTRLNYNENDLSINYSLLDLKSFGKIKYRYKLSPIQKDWQTTSDRNIIFNNLSPNKYRFQLEAIDNHNFKYKLKEEFKFQIKKPFWKTIPFFLCTIILALSSFYLFDKRRKQRLNKEVQNAKNHNRKMANLKLEALRSQMNPHFVFNALGAIQYYIQTHKIDEADTYLTLFANLMRKYLNSSSEQLISLQDELSLLNDYIRLEEMRFENIFKTEIEIDSSINTQSLIIPSMMIQPYVENAINHGLLHRKDGAAKLILSIFKGQDGSVQIEIRDNGIGREKAKKYKKRFHKSKGMINVADRIESLKAAELIDLDISINNNSNDSSFPGTRVVVKLKKQAQWNTQQLS